VLTRCSPADTSVAPRSTLPDWRILPGQVWLRNRSEHPRDEQRRVKRPRGLLNAHHDGFEIAAFTPCRPAQRGPIQVMAERPAEDLPGNAVAPVVVGAAVPRCALAARAATRSANPAAGRRHCRGTRGCEGPVRSNAALACSVSRWALYCRTPRLRSPARPLKQFTAANDPAARLEPLWMACASNSSPVPVSLRISRGKSRAMARRMVGTSASICASLVCGYFRPLTGCGAVAT